MYGTSLSEGPRCAFIRYAPVLGNFGIVIGVKSIVRLKGKYVFIDLLKGRKREPQATSGSGKHVFMSNNGVHRDCAFH